MVDNVEQSLRLMNALAEQLKTPFIQIARSVELAKITQNPYAHLDTVELTADTALGLLDSYLLSMRSRETMLIEPVSISAMLHSVANKLQKMADQYNCQLELHLSGRYEPVMADSVGLEAAMVNLGLVFIESQGQIVKSSTKPVIKLAAHRGNKGIVAGMFSESHGHISADMYRRARKLYGYAPQAITGLTASSGAGVFVAESLLNSMSVKLRPARHQKLSGLAATFMSSSQLSLL